MNRCQRHEFDEASDRCRACRYDYCGSCLVYVHGPERPPLCVPCALSRAGVRSTAAPRRRRSWRDRGGAAMATGPDDEPNVLDSMSGKVAVGLVTATLGVLAAPIVSHLI